LGSCPQWLEEGLRAAFCRDACSLLAQLFADPQLDDSAACPLEKRYADRPVTVQTLFGLVEVRRSYYHHAPSGAGRCALDEKLGLVHGFSPAVARLMCRASAKSGSYAEAAQDLQAYAGVEIEARAFERLVKRVTPDLCQALATLPPASQSPPIPILYVSSDGTGVPMRRAEVEGRAGRQPDGTAKTREAKLGCVLTQSTSDENGLPLRDPDSTSYVGTFGGSTEVGVLLRQEALRRGLGHASQVVYIGDGAAWVWENARINFPGATEILDFYHAAEHAGELATVLFGPDGARQQDIWIERMKETDPSSMLDQARSILDQNALCAERAVEARRQISYFEGHATRTRYGEFQAKGYFIGSGVIEAGCKCVVGRRLKQSGMFWSESGAENLLAMRCLILGPHLDAAWAARSKLLKIQQAKARRWLPNPN
jgi:hypothetical protein